MHRFAILALILAALPAAARDDGKLPAFVLQLPDSVSTLLIAEADASLLHRIENRQGASAYIDERYMSIGQNGVGKKRPWDRRTPLGIYFVTERLDTSSLHEKYGPMAFPLDYPNAWDRRNKRRGDGIWLHGVTEGGGRRPPLDTDGCIALPNDALRALEPRLVPTVTPVIIARQMRWSDARELANLRTELSAALQDWARSREQGDMHRYVAAYADDFEYRGMSRDDWIRYRIDTMASTAIDEVVLDNVLLLADPEEDGLYLSRFRQAIRDDDRTIVTIKRLYWRRTADGLKIVAEDDG